MQKTSFSVNYRVPKHVLYNTMTDQMELCRLIQGQAVSEPKPSGKYNVYDGMIYGIYTELIQNEKIVMKWRMKDWKHKEGADPSSLDPSDAENDFSLVELTFAQGDDSDSCEVSLKQVDVPQYDKYQKSIHIESVEGGWRKMIFERIEQVFGYPMKK